MLTVLAQLIGIYIALTGAVFLLRPRSLHGYVGFWKQSRRLYFIGGSRIVMGAVLLWAGPACRLPVVILASGIIMIAAGLPYFILPPEKLKNMFSRWQNRPAISVRVLGAAIFSAGIILLYSV